MNKTATVADEVFFRIESDILDGPCKPGDLLTEMKLCEQLHVSRTPVREALTRLRQEELIADTPKGAVVVGISEKDLCDIYDIRMRVEGMAAALCAERISDADLQKLENTVALQMFYARRQQCEQLKELDGDFHRTVYDLCGNRTLSAILHDLHRKVQYFRRLSVQNPQRAYAAAEEHMAILGALQAHDPAKAEELTVAHIRHAKENILKMKEA